MQFIKALQDRIRSGAITSSIRIWQRPHVRVGGRYSLPPGQIVVTSILEMPLADVTPALARRSGFTGLVELFKTAQHGRGHRVFLVEFRYLKPGQRLPRHAAKLDAIPGKPEITRKQPEEKH